MKQIFTLILIVLASFTGQAQWYSVNNTSGTSAVYGTTTVGVLGGGLYSTYAGWCGAAPYWIGDGSGGTSEPGWYTFSFSPAATTVRIYSTASDPGESISIYINGTRYHITLAELSPWPGTCAETIMTVSGDSLLSIGYNSSAELTITYCPINTIEVETDGESNGTVFSLWFSDSASCFRAYANTPCVNDTLKLDAIGDSLGATYAWTGPGGFTSTSKIPFIYPCTLADTGIYRVIRLDTGAYDTSYIDVVIYPKPSVTASSNAPLCAGLVDTLHLSVTPFVAGETFAWTGPNTYSSTLQFPVINGFNPINVGTYTVIATSVHGCKDTGTTNAILVPVPPTPVLSGITSYCQNATFVPFTVSGTTGTILWYTTGVGGVGSGVAPVVNTAVTGTYSYWASQTITGCESNRAMITVVVHPTPPAPTVAGTLAYCQFEGPFVPLTVTTSANSIALWYHTATGGGAAVIEPPVDVNTLGSGAYVYNYWVSQIDTLDGCESPRTPVTITVNPKPVPPVVQDVPNNYCPGQVFVPFTVVSGINITWYSNAAGAGASNVAPAINTTIPGSDTVWVSQTTAAGCISDTIPYVVTVYDKVVAGFDFTIGYGCKGDTLTFTNTSTGTTNYSWIFGDISPVSLAANPMHIYLNQGNYTITLYASSANCIDSFKKPVALVHPLKAQFTVDTNLLCQGGSVTFTDASIATGATYLWNFGDGKTSSNVINPTHGYPHTGVYRAYEVITDFVPCTDTAFRTISVDTTSPIYLAISDSVLCVGTYVTFTGNYSSIGNTGITWNFSDGNSIKNINPVSHAFQAPGTYTVTAAATYRVCTDTSTYRTLTIQPQPVITLGPDTTICKGGDPVTLVDKTNSGKANAAWKWSTGQTSAQITITEPGTYSATVKIDGCSSSATVNVANSCYMNIPNIFSPNGDGVNDYFYPRNELTSGLITFSMEIYNRWGQQVFATTSLEGRGWDGKLNNADQPEGVYVYVIDGTFKDGQMEHHQGNITLIR